MAEIGFYHLQKTPLGQALPKLLEKALAAGFRIVVQAPSDTEVERLTALLWSYDPDSFLPHGSAKDGYEADQPIYLTALPHNPNAADMLVRTGAAEWRSFEPFRRVLDLFDGNDPEELAAARDRWRRYKADGHKTVYYQQRAEGGWERKA